MIDAESQALIGGVPFEAAPSRRRDLGALHDLLLKACPREPDGISSIRKLSGLIEISPPAIYQWIDKGVISAKRARAVVAVSEGRVSFDEFMPFLG